MLFQGMRSWLSRRGASRARVWLLHALAALVLLTQQAGVLHSIQHERRDEGVAAHSVCKICLAFHAADHTVATQPTTWVGAQADHLLSEHHGQAQCATGVSAGFQPRAPPHGLS